MAKKLTKELIDKLKNIRYITQVIDLNGGTATIDDFKDFRIITQTDKTEDIEKNIYYVPVSEILMPEPLTIYEGNQEVLDYGIEPAEAEDYIHEYGGDLKFSSSDESVATVSMDTDFTVTVHAVAAGTCVITAEVDGKQATCTVTVTSEK
jgi:hypothetical protein